MTIIHEGKEYTLPAFFRAPINEYFVAVIEPGKYISARCFIHSTTIEVLHLKASLHGLQECTREEFGKGLFNCWETLDDTISNSLKFKL